MKTQGELEAAKARVMALAASGCCASELSAVETARPSP
jgi:hypothetical protein